MLRIRKDNNMCHLREFIKGWIEFQKEEFDCSDMTEEEVFEIVMENVESMVADYGYQDYSKEEK